MAGAAPRETIARAIGFAQASSAIVTDHLDRAARLRAAPRRWRTA